MGYRHAQSPKSGLLPLVYRLIRLFGIRGQNGGLMGGRSEERTKYLLIADKDLLFQHYLLPAGLRWASRILGPALGNIVFTDEETKVWSFQRLRC